MTRVHDWRSELHITDISGSSSVLVPLDGRGPSSRAVPVGGRIAKRLGVGLRLISVSKHDDDSQADLQAIADRLLPDQDVTVEIVEGPDVAEAIVAGAGSSSLICMATAATILPHQGHLGSVAEDVVRLAQQPVILIGPKVDLEDFEPTKRIVVPVDGSAFSEQSVAVGGDLARKLGVEAWVVSVIPYKAERVARGSLGPIAVIEESGYVRRLASSMAGEFGIAAGFEVLHIEDPAEAIVDFAGDDGVVVMSTHGRSGFSRLFAGSVTTGVVAHSKRPVVVWRPPDAPSA